MSADRGVVHLSWNGALMSQYYRWRTLKGYEKTERKQVDLCHFMRVIIFFSPWRRFWQGEILGSGVPPWIVTVILSMLGFVIYAFVAWTGVSLKVLMWIGFVIAALAIACLIGAGAGYVLGRHAQRVERIFYLATMPIWWPILKIGHGIRRTAWALNDHVLQPAGSFLFQRPLFQLPIRGMLYPVTSAGIFALVLVVGVEYLIWLSWVRGLIIHLSLLAALLLVAGIVYLIWWNENVRKPRLREQAANADEVETKPVKSHETRNAIWQWLVSKKYRICPLIETTSAKS